MIVVKLGGSLSRSDDLLNCLNVLEKTYHGGSLIIVPGGGAFAEQVREAQQHWHFDDKTAHHMAILAMQQMALMIKSLKTDFAIANTIDEFQDLSGFKKIVIWSPNIAELDSAGIVASWNITSDSLSAWLANKISASELVLIKSCVIDPQLSLQQLADLDIVDKAFCSFVDLATFKIHIINSKCFETLGRYT